MLHYTWAQWKKQHFSTPFGTSKYIFFSTFMTGRVFLCIGICCASTKRLLITWLHDRCHRSCLRSYPWLCLFGCSSNCCSFCRIDTDSTVSVRKSAISFRLCVSILRPSLFPYVLCNCYITSCFLSDQIAWRASFSSMVSIFGAYFVIQHTSPVQHPFRQYIFLPMVQLFQRGLHRSNTLFNLGRTMIVRAIKRIEQ